jgi:hypothetical protein
LKRVQLLLYFLEDLALQMLGRSLRYFQPVLAPSTQGPWRRYCLPALELLMQVQLHLYCLVVQLFAKLAQLLRYYLEGRGL